VLIDATIPGDYTKAVFPPSSPERRLHTHMENRADGHVSITPDASEFLAIAGRSMILGLAHKKLERVEDTERA
jgi:hypothetical protein